jgi:hypothetical protein
MDTRLRFVSDGSNDWKREGYMADTVVKLAAGQPVTVKMSFTGIANHYAAYLYAPAPGMDQWQRVQTLESDGSSEDARPDMFTFAPPEPGRMLLFFFQSPMTTVVAPSNVEVIAKVEQQGEAVGEALVSGPVTTFVNVVLRIQLVVS